MKSKKYKGIVPFEKGFIFFGEFEVIKQTICGTTEYIYYDKNGKLKKCTPNENAKRFATKNNEVNFFLVSSYDDYFIWELKVLKKQIEKETSTVRKNGLKRRTKVLNDFRKIGELKGKRW